MNILLIEDNIPLAQTIVRYISTEGISCTLRNDGESGYTEVMNHDYDVLIIDIGLPKMDGIEVCRRLRNE